MFQCLNRHEQPSSMIRPGFVGQIDRFNASIGTSNLQALQNLIERRLAFLVSMPQSARATFKPAWPDCASRSPIKFQCLNRHEQPSSVSRIEKPHRCARVSMPQSARATFKPRYCIAEPAPGRFQCLNRHEQPSSPRASHPHSRCTSVSMPQSARATFKPAI